jgi:histidinol-phosphate aminotransferase
MRYNPLLDNIKTYEAGKPIELVVREYGVEAGDIIKLASNENPYGSSKKVIQAIQDSANSANIYPDDSMYELKDALALEYNVKSDNIIIGAGSDQVIEFAIKSRCDSSSNILIAGVTFAMYEIYARQIGANVIKTDDIKHNLAQFREIVKSNNIDMIFLCLPNNPLGEALKSDEVYKFIDEIDSDTMIVVDGAYQEYAKFKDKNTEIKPKELISRYSNTLYLGTFSKAYGLGGMRVGYGISNSNMIAQLHKLRPPFNITTLSLKSAIVALKDKEFVKTSVINNFVQMGRYIEWIKEQNYEYIPSYTNFITILLPQEIDSKEISMRLLQKGVIIRDLSSYGLNAIRVTIGTYSQNDRFFEIYESLGV